jgi:hypothetical protein
VEEIGAPVLRGEGVPLATTHHEGDPRDADHRLSLWWRAKDGDRDAAAALVRASIYDRDPVAQSAACAATVVMDAMNHRGDAPEAGQALDLLRALVTSNRHEVRQIAAAILDRIEELEDEEDVAAAMPSLDQARRHRSDETVSLGVHGTFAHYATERSPGPLSTFSPFYEYLGVSHAPDLFRDHHHSFQWGGRYSRDSRMEGAERLIEWVGAYVPSGGPRVVFAHSHGGNVALSAAAGGLRIDRLILLSTPAIRRCDDEWRAIGANVGRIAAYRTRLDKVILIDQIASRVGWGGEQREVSDGLDFPSIAPIFQPQPRGLLKHSSWLTEKVWRSRGIHGSVLREIFRP